MTKVVEDTAVFDDAAQAKQARIEKIKEQQAALAVDETDPRVQPHLEKLQDRETFDADANQRHQELIDQSTAAVRDAKEWLDTATDQLNKAQDRQLRARARYQTQIDAATKLGGPQTTLPMHQHLSPGEDTVPMFFPRPVTLIADSGKHATFDAGIHLVPESLQTHWWLIDNGVRPYTGSMPEPRKASKPEEPVTEEQELAEAERNPMDRPVQRSRALADDTVETVA